MFNFFNMMREKFAFLNKFNLNKILSNFFTLTVKYHSTISIIGFVVILMFIIQIYSGILLAFSLIPEPMLVPLVRDEEDLEDLFTDDMFWIHERGVDIIFVFSYLHLLRKLYLTNYYLEQEFAWKSGVFILMLIQVVTFLGLVLCSTHLSDITLKIAANTLHTFLSFKSKAYWWLFTDKNLNTDTMVRLAYAHYLSAFALFYLVIIHSLDMHYDWKQDFNFDSIDNELTWWNEVILNEIFAFIELMAFFFLICLYLYSEPEALSYELFMWGDVGAITDPKFNQVAPHWYFRPLMAFLLVVPHAILGVLGLVFFFILLYFQLSLHSNSDVSIYKDSDNSIKVFDGFTTNYSLNKKHIEYDFKYQFMFWMFILACMYTTTFLPNGKYYQMLGGNFGLLASYFFIFIYLAFPTFRTLSFLDNKNLRKFYYSTISKCYY